jgi:AMP-activated protein kinase-like protein
VPRRIRLAVLAFIILLPLRAAAQTVGSVDAGVTRIGYTDLPGITAYSLSPALQVLRPSASLLANGVFSYFDGGGWTLQGTTAGSIFLPRGSPVQVELGGTLAGSVDVDGNKSAELLAQPRLHWGTSRRGMWVGGGLGSGWNGNAWQTVGLVEAAGWVRIKELTAVLNASPNWVGPDLRYLDTQTTARLVHGPLELGAYGGFRTWFTPDGTPTTGWAGASVAYWLTPRLAIVAAGGSYPKDFAQGFPGGSYLAVTVRIATRRPPTPSRVEAREYRLLEPLARPVVPAFRVTTTEGQNRLVRLRAPGATSVEIMGDFTDWQPVGLEKKGRDEWSAVVRIPAGTHRVNLRVDQGPWGVPPGIPVLDDDFGGVVGILVVGPAAGE